MSPGVSSARAAPLLAWCARRMHVQDVEDCLHAAVMLSSTCFAPDTCSAGQTCALLSAFAADGIIPVKRAFYKCGLCQQVVGQAPSQFLLVGAWPGSMSSSHLKTVYDQKLLQLWDSHWLHNPQSSLSGFLKGIAHAAREAHGTVRFTQLSAPCLRCFAVLSMLRCCAHAQRLQRQVQAALSRSL